MKDMFQRTGLFGMVGICAMLALAVCGPAYGQQEVQVSGTVRSAVGSPLPGVTVRIRGTNTSTVTDAEGKYALTAPGDAILLFNRIGYRGVGQSVGGRTTLDVTLEGAISVLPEVVVTGYTTQRRADIIGAVSVANVESVERQTSASVLQRLDGRMAGVTVDASGSPGSRSTVRIRGFTSFQNNDPLYIIDGTPVEDSYINWLNPSDIGSVQVLKDASAASIYGSRASNGVVIIETKKGKAGRRQVSLDVRTGVASPVRGYDGILMQDALQYFQVVKQSYLNAGFPIDSVPHNIFGDPNNPTLPKYIYADPATVADTDQWGRPVTVNPSLYAFPNRLIMPGSAGTNWWKAVFSPAQFRDANLAVSGGGADNAYNVSFNYLNQDGTAAYNRFQRGALRVNTTFTVDRVNVGENLSLSREEQYGGIPNDPTGYAEDGIMGKDILMQPVIPVYDINGYFASGKATGLGNQTNPLRAAWAQKDNLLRNTRLFGNVFAGLDVTNRVALKTRFGFNLNQAAYKVYNPIRPEDSEASLSNSIRDSSDNATDWTWSNTLTYTGTFARHGVSVLLGQEVNELDARLLAGGMSNLLSTDPNARFIRDVLGDATTKNVHDSASTTRLLSIFGKIDYNFADKYYLNLTVRRDGSSAFAPAHRWGTFPAVGAGWRLSREPFLAGKTPFSNIMLRFGWGVTGNQRIPTGRYASQFGGSRGDTFYDIGGTGNGGLPGYRLTAIGNREVEWEKNKSTNVGLDLEAFDGKGSLTLDVYQRETDNLLFDPRTPGTQGIADAPIVNLGDMRNRGIDFSLGYRGTLGEKTLWSVTFNGSHYRNKIIRIDGTTPQFFGPISTRFGNQVVNQVGQPIGAFYGYIADGFYRDSVDAARCGNGNPAGQCWDDGARPGRIKFRDLNGDGRITGDDQTIIGTPHPNFTAGLDLSLRRGAWDLSATLFGTFGNKIFDVQKEFYVFRNFSTNVRNDLLTNSATLDGPCSATSCPGKLTNPDAKYPRLDQNDAFSRQLSSYYVESGTYVRLRNIQIGYTVPPAWISWIPAARVYVQAENLFTLTGYNGLDPALPAANFTGAAGDIRDQYRGVDRGSYPSSRTVTIGISTTF
jgi:TonB-dependent starch-binding outer membrane protein SusC